MKISSFRECGNFRLRAKSMRNQGSVNPTRLRRRFVKKPYYLRVEAIEGMPLCLCYRGRVRRLARQGTNN